MTTASVKTASKTILLAIGVVVGFSLFGVTTFFAAGESQMRTQTDANAITAVQQKTGDTFVTHQLKIHAMTGDWDRDYKTSGDGLKTCLKVADANYIVLTMKEGEHYASAVINADPGYESVEVRSDGTRNTLCAYCVTGEVQGVKPAQVAAQSFSWLDVFFGQPSTPKA